MYVAVFDVNVLVSSLIMKGKPRELWLKARANEFTLLLSRQIVSEFIDVISRRKFARYVKEYDVRVFLEALHQTAKFTRIKSKFKVVKADPADDTILRTAFDGKADCIVSGDNHLLSLGTFRGIRILTVDEMLTLLKEERQKNKDTANRSPINSNHKKEHKPKITLEQDKKREKGYGRHRHPLTFKRTRV